MGGGVEAGEGTYHLIPCYGEVADGVLLFHGPGVFPHGLVVGHVDVTLTKVSGDSHAAGLALYAAGHGDYGLFGDSSIAICWITSENKRLSLYHRNRVVQVRFHTELEKIFHLRKEHNPADIGTRPDKVKRMMCVLRALWKRG